MAFSTHSWSEPVVRSKVRSTVGGTSPVPTSLSSSYEATSCFQESAKSTTKPPPWKLVTPGLVSSIVFHSALAVRVPSLSVYWSEWVMPTLSDFLWTSFADRRKVLGGFARERQAEGLVRLGRGRARQPEARGDRERTFHGTSLDWRGGV